MFGSEDTDSLCPMLPAEDARTTKLSGGHHMDSDYAGIARAIAALTGRS